MREHDIGAIPIGENDQLIGMVTDRDIVCKGLAQDSFDAGRATARDVMTPGIHCCREDDDLAKAIRPMETLKVRRLPVINKSRRMVGILSLATSAIRRLAISCPNGSRAFRRTTEPSDDTRPAEDLCAGRAQSDRSRVGFVEDVDLDGGKLTVAFDCRGVTYGFGELGMRRRGGLPGTNSCHSAVGATSYECGRERNISTDR
jgi:CBS-domain-containing membrane protein